MRKFKKEDLLEMDFNAYLASSSDEEEPQEREEIANEEHDSSEDEDTKIDKYKVSCLLLWIFSLIIPDTNESQSRKVLTRDLNLF